MEIGYYLIFHSTEGGSVVIFDKQCILILPTAYTKKEKHIRMMSYLYHT